MMMSFEKQKIKFKPKRKQPRLKKFNLNLILTCNTYMSQACMHQKSTLADC